MSADSTSNKPSVRDIFLTALDVPSPAEREAYLARACGSDAALRAKVDALLRNLREDGFLEQPAANVLRTNGVPEAAPPEKPGDAIGRYKLLEQIGEGGCGVVYMAEQEEPVRRRVALKVIKLGMETKNVIARFEAERQALALMDHPNIAKVFDAGATQTGRPYFVMELVRGTKITDYCDGHNLSTRQRLDLFLQVCHAIQHAHQKGIIHRDIKPSNILVSLHDGVPVPVVIDFGIAKATAQRLTDKTLFTAFQQFIGTPAYMSPEQAEMSRLDVDTRSDIYSLGVLLYELLTGRTPLEAKALLAAGLDEMRRTIREHEPTRPSTRLNALPGEELTTTAKRRGTDAPKLIQLLRGDLDWIVMKALEKDRTRRYETANGLAQDIRRHLANEPVTARPPSTVYRLQKFARRNKGIVTAGTAVAAALVLGAVGSTYQAVRATRAEREQSRQRQLAVDSEQKASQAQAHEAKQRRLAETKTEESRGRLVQLNVASGARLLNENETFGALPWLVEALRLEQGRAEGEELQRLQLGVVLQQCPKLVQIWFHDGPVSCAAFSPDGRHVATATGTDTRAVSGHSLGQAQVWDVATGQPVGRPMRHRGGINQLRFSPDGRRIATASADGTAWLCDTETGDLITAPLAAHTDEVTSLAFSRDGKLLATAGRDYTAWVWNTQTGAAVSGPLPHLYRVTGVDFSSGGERLVSVSPDGWLRVWDVKFGTKVFSSAGHSGFLGGVQCSPDGSQWLTTSGEGTARLWDAKHEAVVATFHHDAAVLQATFSPDGQRILTASSDHTARVWDAKPAGQLRCSLRHAGAVYDAEFSPDGMAVVTASGDHTARVWDAQTGQPLTPSLPHQDKVGSAIFSPDGHQILTVSDDRTACLWELAVGGPSLELNHQLAVTRLALSPNQLRVLTSSTDRTARLWDLKTGQPVGPPLEHLRAVSEAVFSPEGQRLLTASFDGTARIWEAGTGKPMTPPLQHQEGVVHAAFSPDGCRVATGSTDRSARVWDAATGEPTTPFLLHDREVQWVAFSPDGKRLVSASRDRLARVWDAMTGQEQVRLSGHTDWVLLAAFSPNGRQILTAGADMTARLWDAASGKPQAPPLAHSWTVSAAAFSLDGSRVVTGSYDGTARVWDALTGQAVTRGLLHGGCVEQVAFSSDGRWVLTASWDNTVRLWSATTGDPIAPPIRLGDRVRDARLTADGQTLVVASGSAAYVWSLAAEGRQLSDLQLLSGLLTGEARDAEGRLSRLDTKQVWQTLKTAFHEPKADEQAAIKAWHRRALVQGLKQRDTFAVRFHLDRLLGSLPGDEALVHLRSGVFSNAADSGVSAWVISNELAEARSRIPPPAPGTPVNVIDLSDYYNRALSDTPFAVVGASPWALGESYQLSGLARGVQTLAGVKFDLRGWVQLQHRGSDEAPERVVGIKIAHSCRRLYFLHGTIYPVDDGTEIAQYVIHYADGQQSVWPVLYGDDVCNFFALRADQDQGKAAPAWAGTNPLAVRSGFSMRLYKSAWENPRPDVAVESIDFISNLTRSAPFLIAVTAED